ncbi:MAG: amidase [Beijerinckiaceae bacterium]|nr:amidase [Beijerinckiaceae bacterium]
MEAIDRPIEALAPDLRNGSLDPVTLTEAALARIEARDGTLKSMVEVNAGALAAAREARDELRRGEWRGPLHGIPIGVKDNYLTADMNTTAGTSAPGVSFPRIDSAVAARLRAAGAILIGKTRTHEFAWGTVCPPTRNPWDVSRVPGGSSGGSGAAVAAGLCVAALGSDTGGSVRIPASLCGLVGFKPTFGRISRTGIVPHSWSLDHPGPMTHTVTDAAFMLDALAGYDPSDASCRDVAVPEYSAALGQSIAGMTVGICRNHFFGRNQRAVETAVEAAITDLAASGARIVEFELPNLAFGLAAIFAIELASSTAYHDANLKAGRTAYFEEDVRSLVEMGRFVTAVDYLKAEQLRHVLMTDMARVFETVDVIVGPTMPLTAWTNETKSIPIAGQVESPLAASWRLTYPYNLTGLPAVSLPCGFDDDGLPIGLQIAGRPFDETTVLRVAHAYERTHDWHAARPGKGGLVS